jgi:hypothetical protein
MAWKIEPFGDVVRNPAEIKAGSCLSHIVVKRRDHVHRRVSGRNETRSVVDRHYKVLRWSLGVSSEYVLYSDWDLGKSTARCFLLDSLCPQRDPIR